MNISSITSDLGYNRSNCVSSVPIITVVLTSYSYLLRPDSNIDLIVSSTSMGLSYAGFKE